jgi:hypothetical protein
MGQVLHGSATTTEAVRRAIQNSQASLRVLAERHGINSYEYICKIFTSERQRFRLDPLHQMPGLNISPPPNQVQRSKIYGLHKTATKAG